MSSPLVTIAREHVGSVVSVRLQGGHELTGRLIRVADDGQALRLESRVDVSGPTVHFVDLLSVVSISTKEV